MQAETLLPTADELLSDDGLVPAQWVEGGFSAERRLYAALLLDALRCARGFYGKRLQAKAWWWLSEVGDSQLPLSWVCEQLGLPLLPKRLKERLGLVPMNHQQGHRVEGRRHHIGRRQVA